MSKITQVINFIVCVIGVFVFFKNMDVLIYFINLIYFVYHISSATSVFPHHIKLMISCFKTKLKTIPLQTYRTTPC